MASNSKIEWTDATWNPIRARNLKTEKVGWHCEHDTAGCEFCYSEGFNKRLGTGLPFKPGHRKDIEIFLDEEMLLAPLRWKKPRMIFVCSMTDLFASFVKDEWIDKIFAVMKLAPHHTFQVLTKRSDRMRSYLTDPTRQNSVDGKTWSLLGTPLGSKIKHGGKWRCVLPLPNVWLGVSTERQQEFDQRWSGLRDTPAAVRFISYEPALGALDIGAAVGWRGPAGFDPLAVKLDWVIAGGESGQKARLMQPGWVRSLRDQCAAAGVPFFFKQWGEYLPVGQSLPGFGKVHGATAVKPGRMKLHYGGRAPGREAPKHAFAERGVAFASTADGRLTFRVGKNRAGRLLDGVEHNGMPKVAA